MLSRRKMSHLMIKSERKRKDPHLILLCRPCIGDRLRGGSLLIKKAFPELPVLPSLHPQFLLLYSDHRLCSLAPKIFPLQNAGGNLCRPRPLYDVGEFPLPAEHLVARNKDKAVARVQRLGFWRHKTALTESPSLIIQYVNHFSGLMDGWVLIFIGDIR